MRCIGSSLVCSLLASFSPNVADAAASLPPGLYAEISAAEGTMTAERFFRRAPLTVTNFVGLAEGFLGPTPRKPFFDALIFHRDVPGFVVRSDDPLGTGAGDRPIDLSP
ncbi:MAG: peptidylprolyl isomerase [Opitutus sp.]